MKSKEVLPVKLGLTITLRGEAADEWRRMVERFRPLDLSNGQLAVALMAVGLRHCDELGQGFLAAAKGGSCGG